MHGPDALEALEVPELDGHVCGARGQQLSRLVEGDVLHRVCVAFQGALKVSCLIVPHLHRHRHRGREKFKTAEKNKHFKETLGHHENETTCSITEYIWSPNIVRLNDGRKKES